MRISTETQAWAVYRIAAKGTEVATNALCDQRDWSEIEKQGAGRFTLIRGFITNEGEAERLARGTSGDTKPKPPKWQLPAAKKK
jgi:hypothetical protein